MTKSVAISLVIVIFVIFVGINAIMWLPQILSHGERMGIELGKTYVTIGDRYIIGDQLGKTQICDTYIKYGCFKGSLKGVKIIDNGMGALIFFEINKKDVQRNLFGSGYEFQLFGQYDLRQINALDDLPKYALLGDSAHLFSNTDLGILSNSTQEQFKELEKNPTIFINEVIYSK